MNNGVPLPGCVGKDYVKQKAELKCISVVIIYWLFGMDVSKDREYFPQKFYNPCYAAMKQASQAWKDGMIYAHTTTPFVWTEYTHINITFEIITWGKTTFNRLF